MERAASSTLPAQVPTYYFLDRALPWLRWATLAALLLITVMRPAASSVGLPTWALVAVFAAYNLLVELLQRRRPQPRSFTWVAIMDLPIAGFLYLLSGEPGGPLFVLFFLAVDSAVGRPRRGSLVPRQRPRPDRAKRWERAYRRDGPVLVRDHRPPGRRSQACAHRSAR